MEKKGVYNKGRTGHMRNGHNLEMNRHHFFKKFRLPITAVIAFMFVFGMAPIVGEELQGSVLTATQEASSDAALLSINAKVLCNKELPQVVSSLVLAEENLQKFQVAHGSDFNGTHLVKRAASISESVAALVAFMQACATR